MKTWHIITSEYPPDVGGVSDYTQQVARALARGGDDVHVWCPGARRADGEEGGTGRVHSHAELGEIRRRDLKRVDALLDRCPAPRCLLVQWVPHGFGYKSMNVGFCLWLAARARAGDRVELMVHEPFLEFHRGPLRHAAMALVHRLMTVLLMRAASRVWVAIPAWEPMLVPYMLGRRIPVDWLPIPGCLAPLESAPAPVRDRYAAPGRPLIGHFGTFGAAVTTLLDERLPGIMDGASRPSLLLLGAGSERFRASLLDKHASWSGRVHAAGYLTPDELAASIAACDLFVQPYPDGVTSRRTSAMACLSQGRAVVTTHGHLTEPLWAQSGAVALTDVGDANGFVDAVQALLADATARDRLARSGQSLYERRFAVGHVVDALRAA